MTIILIEIAALLTVVSFVVFLAIDDKKNQKIRAEEDLEELKKIAVKNRNDANDQKND